MLGATTVIIERRDGFTRNNVLKLWKFLMEDIKSLGGKKLFGMFCAGNINHVGIKTLQLILSKVAMLLGKQSWVTIELNSYAVVALFPSFSN